MTVQQRKAARHGRERAGLPPKPEPPLPVKGAVKVDVQPNPLGTGSNSSPMGKLPLENESLSGDIEKKFNEQAQRTPNSKLNMSQSDLNQLLSETLEYTLLQPPRFSEAGIDLRQADTPLYSKNLVNREFEVPGYGTAIGGEINYIGVGMMMAHYGIPFAAVPTLTTGWNANQMLTGEGLYNYNQTFSGSFWAGYGYKYYQEHRKTD